MKLTAIAFCLGLMACATTAPQPETAQATQDRLAALLPGVYQSSPTEGARAGRAIYQTIVAVAPPVGFTHALYSEMRHDGPSGDLYRQTVFLMAPASDGRMVMTSRGVSDGAAARALLSDPNALRSGAVALTPGIGGGCDMVWRADKDGFLGRIDPATCQITGRRGDQRRIESVMRIGPRAIEHAEYGYDLDGKLLFGGPPGRRYVWPRVEAAAGSPSSADGESDRRPRRSFDERMREAEGRSLVAELGEQALHP